MALHQRDEIRDSINDPVFGGGALAGALPKYRFPAGESPPEPPSSWSPTRCCSTATAGRTWRRSARPGRSRRSTG